MSQELPELLILEDGKELTNLEKIELDALQRENNILNLKKIN